jgi:hypothetical protein
MLVTIVTGIVAQRMRVKFAQKWSIAVSAVL